MAPVCTAGCLSLRALIVFMLFLSIIIILNVDALYVYDRQTLLNLRSFVENCAKFHQFGQKICPPLLSDVPAYLCLTPAPPVCRRRGRCEKRSERLVKLKAGMLFSHAHHIEMTPSFCVMALPGPD